MMSCDSLCLSGCLWFTRAGKKPSSFWCPTSSLTFLRSQYYSKCSLLPERTTFFLVYTTVILSHLCPYMAFMSTSFSTIHAHTQTHIHSITVLSPPGLMHCFCPVDAKRDNCQGLMSTAQMGSHQASQLKEEGDEGDYTVNCGSRNEHTQTPP